MTIEHSISCQVGWSAGRRVAIGFAAARVLYALSFADVLVEETGRGYQRRFNAKHSLDFRKYIQKERSSTIPLTFNLRANPTDTWSLNPDIDGPTVLKVREGHEKVLVQVDCQHRLGHLNDVDVQLPFMMFLGLDERAEMEIFNVINSKARGLSNSLLDFHEASLASNLGKEKAELYIAIQLNADPDSPWHKQLDLGGTSTSGLKRRASLRTMQKAIKKFLAQTQVLRKGSVEDAKSMVVAFWSAVSVVLADAWNAPRAHVLNKGIGVYALMEIAADLQQEAADQVCDKRYFSHKLSEFIDDIDWTQKGTFDGLGGQSGVTKMVASIREVRGKARLTLVKHG
nr:DGQHR domain-containing protein [Granulicella sp. dw_53]